jgi:hypothetical protein
MISWLTFMAVFVRWLCCLAVLVGLSAIDIWVYLWWQGLCVDLILVGYRSWLCELALHWLGCWL